MTRRLTIGDHVSWNSEAGRVRGRIIRIHDANVEYKGYIHHADKEDPLYEIKSDRTDHIALHEGQGISASSDQSHHDEPESPGRARSDRSPQRFPRQSEGRGRSAR